MKRKSTKPAVNHDLSKESNNIIEPQTSALLADDEVNLSGKSVAVLVMGDLGRSPRMQYHTYSFAQQGLHVDFIGYEGTSWPIFLMEQRSTNHPPPPKHKNNTGERLRDEVEFHGGITQHRLRQLPRMPRALFLLYAVLKVLLLLLQLLWVLLFKIQKPSLILVQVRFSSLLTKDEDVTLQWKNKR